jgi:hypothetical protein
MSAIFARFKRRINSSVLPENMQPHTTSIHPERWPLKCGSKNIIVEYLTGKGSKK